LGITGLAILTAIKSRRQLHSSVASNNNKKNRRLILGVFSLTLIMGFTWIFGFIAFDERMTTLESVLSLIRHLLTLCLTL
jgi:hypothetical protein